MIQQRILGRNHNGFLLVYLQNVKLPMKNNFYFLHKIIKIE